MRSQGPDKIIVSACMAPNFLSKLVKVASPTSGRERRASETEAPRTSGVVPRRQSISQSNITTPTQANTSTLISENAPVSTITTTINKAHSFESVGSLSTQPNVTIVPPSPLIQSGEFSDDDDDDDDGYISTADHGTSTPTNKDLPSMPTPTHPPATPASPNLTNGKTNPAMASNASLAPKSLQVRKKLSTQSMKSTKSVKKVPSALDLNTDPKTATPPADVVPDSVTKTAIVDSPTDIKSASPVPVVSPEKSNSASTANLTIQRQNTDTASISSKRPWRKSTTRKPTGLASAIAASGLAMANPALSPSHQAQIPPPTIISPQQSISSATSKKSTPYMSISPAQSSASQQHLRTRSTELSPKHLKPKKSTNGMSTKGSRPRKSSVSVNSENGSEYFAGVGDEVRPEYYSGLGGSSDEDGSGSDLDSDDLELGDDNIPVTGFAVASNKRNADFHELFPTVPEGDYLIEGGRLVSGVKVFFLISFFLARLWLCVAKRNPDPRTTLYL